jgi:hypothetical protein
MDEQMLQRSLRARPPADPMYRPRLADRLVPAVRPAARPARLPWGIVLLLVALVLAAGMAVAGGQLLSPSPSRPVGAFSPTGSLTYPRADHTATELLDGRVLVVGGLRDYGGAVEAVALVDVWDPSTGSARATGPLVQARGSHSATRLLDGRVLVVGGFVGDSGRVGSGPGGDLALASAEIWDPATETFTTTGSLAHPRYGHTATLLSDGRVLVVGGNHYPQDTPVSEAEIWDPRTGRFEPAGTLAHPGDPRRAALLPDGRVLVAGGGGAELWDPTSMSFSPAGSVPAPPDLVEGTLLPDGRLLVINTDRTAWIHDPVTRRWTATGWLAEHREGHTTTLLRDGRVLVTGGRTITPGQCVSSPRPDGSCFARTGRIRYLATAELFDPTESP